jgi:thioredoxin reductase/Pyruvate/2-oxoacid:ferredoxin oxidoreductase delta subunit
MEQGSLIMLALVTIPVMGGAMVYLRRHAQQRRDGETLRHQEVSKKHLARSLHPVIDADRCIGSGSCLNACPEGDILGMVGHSAKLIHGDHCIGHGGCAEECPVQAIRLVFGSAERGVDLPQVDRFFESSRPGVLIVGELAGMGLIKNALLQGLQAADRLAEVTPPGGTVVVVGAGPAGLATALALQAKGVAYRLLEQGSVGGTIFHYPRRKVAMTGAVDLPLVGSFGKPLITKEELLEGWDGIIAKVGLVVEQGVKMTGLDGADGAFTALTTAGPISAAKVVLAIGRRGTPRKLGVPGEELEKVVYALTEPEQYQGTRVLVVGGGDAAIEAAVQLATESSAEVTISYRNADFSGCREANRARVGALIAAGRLRALLPSRVVAVEADAVQLDAAGSPLRIGNDFVIINIGGEQPVEFLSAVGVSMRRFHGEELGTQAPAPGSAPPSVASGPVTRPLTGLELGLQRRRTVRRILYVALGLSVLAYLTSVGWPYYLLPHLAREHSPLHKALRSAGRWGHGVGMVATAVMLSNFLLAVRKRVRRLNGLGDIASWLDFHVFVGFLSPLVIAFHAAFEMNNGLATGTYAALAVVVLTGVIGRYIYGLVPAHTGDHFVELEELGASFERLRAYAAPELVGTSDGAALLDRATSPVRSGSLLALFVRYPFESISLRIRLRLLRRRLQVPEHYRDLRAALVQLTRLRWQLRFYKSLKRLLRGWRLFHTTAATFLVVTLVAHIGLALFLGYGLGK